MLEFGCQNGPGPCHSALPAVVVVRMDARDLGAAATSIADPWQQFTRPLGQAFTMLACEEGTSPNNPAHARTRIA